MLGKFDRITFDEPILGGQACIRNMRIPVSLIIDFVAYGKQLNEIIGETKVLAGEPRSLLRPQSAYDPGWPGGSHCARPG